MIKNFLILLIISIFALKTKEKYNINETNWMTQLNFNLPLNQLVIPGCHDSMTGCLANKTCSFQYNLVKEKFLNKIIIGLLAPRYIITQQFGTVDQILNGARYIDLRLYWTGTDWYGVHGFENFVTTQKITDLLDDIYNKFLKQPNKEIVILNFLRFLNGVENGYTILDYISKNWDTKYIVANKFNPSSTYQEITADSQNNKAIILWGSAFSKIPSTKNILSNYIWYSNNIHDCWSGIGNDPIKCCSTLPITTWDDVYDCYILPQLNIPSISTKLKKIDCSYEQPNSKITAKNVWHYIAQSTKTLLQRAEKINKSLVKFLCNGSGNNTKCLNYVPPTKGLNILSVDGWDKKYLSSFYDINSRIMNF